MQQTETATADARGRQVTEYLLPDEEFLSQFGKVDSRTWIAHERLRIMRDHGLTSRVDPNGGRRIAIFVTGRLS